MLRIKCPFCGERDHSEFSYGGDASIVYPELDGTMEEWVKAVFERENIKGLQEETWQHVQGCRMWIVVMRNNVTHEILSVKPAHQSIKKILDQEKDDK